MLESPVECGRLGNYGSPRLSAGIIGVEKYNDAKEADKDK